MLNVQFMLAMILSNPIHKNDLIWYTDKPNKCITMEFITLPKPTPMGDWLPTKVHCKKEVCFFFNELAKQRSL